MKRVRKTLKIIQPLLFLKLWVINKIIPCSSWIYGISCFLHMKRFSSPVLMVKFILIIGCNNLLLAYVYSVSMLCNSVSAICDINIRHA